MELIILIIVASIIGNVVKSIREAQQNTTQPYRKIPGQGDFPGKGFNLPGNQPPKVNTYTTQDLFTNSYGEQKNNQVPQSRSENRQIATSSITPVTASATDPVTSSVTASKIALEGTYSEVSEPIHVIDLDQTQKHHKLDFSPNTFINGIILYEVLGPPKSRRQ